MNTRFLLITLGLVSILCLSACGPRGESRPLDDILQSSQQRYNMVRRVEVPAEVRETLDQSILNMEALLADSDVAENSGEMSRHLLILSEQAGYTNRPALFEIMKQYQSMKERAGQGGVHPASVKLLVSRTYSLFASELETTRFSL